jgi:hypothetical protein
VCVQGTAEPDAVALKRSQHAVEPIALVNVR